MLLMILKRLLFAIPSLVGVVIVTFLLTRALPGDPAAYFAGPAPAPLGRIDVFFSAPPPVTGFYLIDSLIAGQFDTFMASLKQLVLPALTLGIFSLAPIARMTRASMLAVLASDFVRTARASGLTPFTVIVTYAFRNAMLPVITTLGMLFSFLLGANVLVEKVFAWPGICSVAVQPLLAP